MNLQKQLDQKTSDKQKLENSQGNNNQDNNINIAEKSIKFITAEASRMDRKIRTFSYKHPLVIMTAGLVAGYATHWMLNKSSFQKNE